MLSKELLLERRAPQTLVAMALFSATTYVLFHFALRRDTVDGDLASGILWVTLLLAALLGIGRLFVADRDEGGLDGFLLAPVDRTALFLAKATALLVFLVALQVVAVPLFAVLLLGPVTGIGAGRASPACWCSPTSGSRRSARSWPRSPCRPAPAT